MNPSTMNTPSLDRLEHGIEWNDDEDAAISRMCRERNPLTAEQIAESEASMKRILAKLGHPLDDAKDVGQVR
ncbi:MAG TPA: hypothetical protein PLW14_09110 [Chlorobiota bacterium]|nr:hypothetical protein [Chlorobiota bacterium]